MGWTVGYSSCREMLDDLRSDRRHGDHQRLLKSCVRGNVLWSVVANYRVDGPEPRNYIGVDLMRNFGGQDGWGYKDMCESVHPYNFSCPLSYLALAPVQNLEWRKSVNVWHQKQKRKFTIGECVELVGCRIPYLTISHRRPLIGTYQGKFFRVSRQHVAPGSYTPTDTSAYGGAYV